jgi:hypothetical protein
MEVTKEMQRARPALDVAAYLSTRFSYDHVIDGIKLFLSGDIQSVFSFLKWEPLDAMPVQGEFIVIEGKYWHPIAPYSIEHIVQNILINKECPICGNKYHVYDVVPCKKTIPQHKWKSRLECSNEDCLHEEYHLITKNELIEKYGNA